MCYAFVCKIHRTVAVGAYRLVTFGAYRLINLGAYQSINLGDTVLWCAVAEEEVRQWQSASLLGGAVCAEEVRQW